MFSSSSLPHSRQTMHPSVDATPLTFPIGTGGIGSTLMVLSIVPQSLHFTVMILTTFLLFLLTLSDGCGVLIIPNPVRY